MADNVTTQSTTPATPPAATVIATAEVSFSGATAQAGLSGLVEITGPEGSRTAAIISPATSSKQDTANSSLSSIDTKTPSLGQALASASVPVALPAAQVTALTPPAAIAGFATESTLDARTGSLTEAAPATDTASSGLNGRLQRIAQRLTSLITALGSPFQAGASIGNTTFASTQSGAWTVQPGNTANTTAWKVDGSAVTQPVSAASLPLPALAATSTKQSDGTQKTQVVDGSGNVIGATSNALDVNIKSGASSGTEYVEDAAAAANPSGPMSLARRRDTLTGAEVSADGDNIALNATDKGQLHVKLADTVTVDGSGVTQPVSASSLPLPSGAATAAKQDTGNTSLASIDGKITAVNTGAVVVSSSALPSGAATAAKQPALGTAGTASVDVVSVQGIASMTALKVDGSAVTQPVSVATIPSHAVTNAGTFAVQVDGAALTSLQLIDDAVFAEDVASQAADKGVQILTVRKDTAAATSGTDGDYQPPVSNARGATWVAIEDGAGGQITSFGGGTQYTEDAAAAANPLGNALALVRDDARGGSLVSADGDNVAARGTNAGELYVKHVDAIPVTDSGGSLTVDGTVAVSALPASTNTLEVVGDVAHDAVAAGNPVLLGAYAKATAPTDVSADGDAVRVWADLAGRVQVGDGGATLSVDDGAGSLTVDGSVSVSALPASTNTLEVVGDVAHDAVAAGNPVLLGAYAKATAPTDVSADGDAVRVWADLAGRVQVGDGGGSLTVDVGTALPAGTNVIGHVIADSGSTTTVTQATGTNLHTVVDSGTVSTITNVVHVDDNSGSLTVDGTVTASIAAGATTIAKAEDVASADADVGVPAMAIQKAAPANTAGTDGDYAMLQMSAGRLWASATIDAALPAGANAIGKLAANSGVDIGDVDVTTVGTITPGTAATSLGKAEDAAHASGDVGVMALAVRQDTAAALAGTDADYQPLITDASGRLHVNVGNTVTVASHAVTNAGTFAVQATEADGANVTLGAKADAKSTATDTTAITAMSVWKQISSSVQAIASSIAGTLTVASHAVTNAGTFATQVDGSALTSLQLIDDPVIADDAAFTPATSKVMMSGFEADETSTDSVDEGDAGAARMTLDRKLIVTVQPHTAGGWDVMMASSGDGSTALTSTVQAVKASAGKLGGWYIYNPNSSATYVIIYNTASGSVTVGTTNPKMVLCIPATSAANLELVNGITFDTAIAVAATTTGGGSSAPSTALEANFWYK